jgi:hypothetical protein
MSFLAAMRPRAGRWPATRVSNRGTEENEDVTEFGGEFIDPNNRIHKIKGKQQ